MKKDYSLTTIILSIVFCTCAIGLDIIYFKRNVALFSAGMAIAAAMIIVNVVCLILKIKKQNITEGIDKVLMLISMLCTVIAMSIPVVGVLIPVLASL